MQLQNATFELYHGASVEEGALHETLTTDENGSAEFKSLVGGETYTLHEVTAPAGYELLSDVTFTVEKDGTVTLQDAPEGYSVAEGEDGVVTFTAADSSTADEGSATESAAVAGKNGTGTYTASTDGGTAVISATDHLVEVTITKTDGGQGLLPGAEFTATATGSNNGSSAGHSVTATTGEDGTAVLSGLIAGQEYTLTETKAPAGYELLTDMLTFTVQADGTIDAGFFPPAAFAIGQAKDAVTVTDNPLEVTLVKQAPNGAPLAGAEFRVEGEFPDGQTEKTFTSDENGIVFHQLQLTGSAEGTLYTVTETKAPEGYAQPSGSLDLLVFEDGTVQVADTSAANMKQNASVTESSGVAVVTLNNEPLPGTELPQTGDNKILPLLAGAFGLLGLWAIVMGTVAYRRFRTKGEE